MQRLASQGALIWMLKPDRFSTVCHPLRWGWVNRADPSRYTPEDGRTIRFHSGSSEQTGDFA
jgi:hypothetical protein